MRVGDFKVRWRYEHVMSSGPSAQEVIRTTCVIENSGSYIPESFISDSVTQHVGDPHIPDKARRVSLKKTLLNNIPDRSKRAEFWEKYRILTKIPRW